jgi:hypothetical protein
MFSCARILGAAPSMPATELYASYNTGSARWMVPRNGRWVRRFRGRSSRSGCRSDGSLSSGSGWPAARTTGCDDRHTPIGDVVAGEGLQTSPGSIYRKESLLAPADRRCCPCFPLWYTQKPKSSTALGGTKPHRNGRRAVATPNGRRGVQDVHRSAVPGEDRRHPAGGSLVVVPDPGCVRLSTTPRRPPRRRGCA